MVRKNCIKIKKPILCVDGTDVLMDKYWYDHIKEHLEQIDQEMPIKEVHYSEKHLIVEFKNAKIATLYRLKYGDEG